MSVEKVVELAEALTDEQVDMAWIIASRVGGDATSSFEANVARGRTFLRAALAVTPAGCTGDGMGAAPKNCTHIHNDWEGY